MRAFLQVVSCRYTAYYFMPFCVVAGVGPRLFPAAFAYWFCFCVAVESLNRVTDRIEDEVNQPGRTALCHRVGYGRLRRIAIGAWILLAVVDVVWVVTQRNPWLGAMLAFNILIGAGYSAGPRFKAWPRGVLVVLTMPYLIPLFTGLAAAQKRVVPALLAGCLLALMALVLTGAKDVTDERGDALRGYRSRWPAVVRSWLAPLLAAQLAACWLGPMLHGVSWTVVLASPVVIIEVVAVGVVVRARSDAEKNVAREVMHNAVLACTSIIMLAVFPGLSAVYAVIVAVAWWTIASRWLHWHRHVF